MYCSSGPEPDKYIHYEQFYKLKSTSMMISGNAYCSSDPEPDKYIHYEQFYKLEDCPELTGTQLEEFIVYFFVIVR